MRRMTLLKLVRLSNGQQLKDVLEECGEKIGLGSATLSNIENGLTPASLRTQKILGRTYSLKRKSLFYKSGRAKIIKQRHIEVLADKMLSKPKQEG